MTDMKPKFDIEKLNLHYGSLAIWTCTMAASLR